MADSAAMAPPVSAGTVVAGFRIVSVIAEGLISTVYLAVGTDRGEHVALKVLTPELSHDDRFRLRFLRESDLAARLDHPHIARALAAGEDDGVLYIATAYVDGSDLRTLLRAEGRLAPERVLHLIGQVAEALDEAHAAGLVHRDVKPGNILIEARSDGEHAYVCDFGLARHLSSPSSLTGDRGFVGTIDYVPPEQIEGGQIDGRADVYSLGCMLFECLAGTRPFDRESELSVVFAHLNEPPPLLSELSPELPEAFDGVFATALAKSPADRYSTCGELVDAARAALKGKAFARRKLRRRRLLLAAGAVATVGATVGVLASRGSHSSAPTTNTRSVALRPNAVNLIDAMTSRVVGHVNLGKPALFSGGIDVTFAGDSAWVVRGGERRVVRVDLARRRITGVVKLPWAGAPRIASGGGSVWVTREDGGPGIVRIDARTGRIANRLAAPAGGPGLVYGAGSLWLARGPDVERLDPRDGHVLRRFPGVTGGFVTNATRISFADGAVWVVRATNGLVSKIDPVENRIAAQAKLHGEISDLTVGGGYVWASVVPDGVVFKLAEDDLSVLGSPASGPDPERISFGGGSLWIANAASKTISLLEPGSGRRSRIVADAVPSTALYHDGIVWVAAASAPRQLAPIAGSELRISTPGAVTSDPAQSGQGAAQQRLYATCANLLTYPDSAGAQGARLRPEIAAAMPTVSPDRRVYTFRIRPGVRFSPPSNEAVTAETFRHTIERALAAAQGPYPPGAPFAVNVLGASAYRAGQAPHISGIAAHGNVLSITLVRPAADLPAWISMLPFCPVPLSEPVHPHGWVGVIPSLGPYYVSSIEGDRTILLRNPNYTGSRPKRAERIVYSRNLPTPQAVALADSGDVDLLPPDYDNHSLLAAGGLLDHRYGAASPAARAGKQRYFLYAVPLLDDIVFNGRRPLFRDPRLRRAVNYALDRPALAAAYYDTPTDQIIPPAVPGYHPKHVYPVDGPDLRTARRLAGRGRRHAVLTYFCGDPTQGRVAQIVRSNLALIGITVSIVKSDACPNRYYPVTEDADLLLDTWPFALGSFELDPAPILDQVLATGAYGSALGRGPWNDPAFRKRVQGARALRGQARITAYVKLQDELLRAAPFAVYGGWIASQYFSPKVGCKVFQAVYHFVDLGALCVPKR